MVFTGAANETFVCNAGNVSFPLWISISAAKACNGIRDCPDGADEFEGLCGMLVFHCVLLLGSV